MKMEVERARNIGRMLFQKYDLGKRGALGPKQCYEVFSDYCFRILSINPQPTMEEANSMYEILDLNKDKQVTESDFENLAIKYLCNNSSIGSNNFRQSNVNSFSQGKDYTQYSSKSVVRTESKNSGGKVLNTMARKRLEVAARLFKMFDGDNSGFLTEEEIPKIMEETYKQMGQVYKASKEDVKIYMQMVDANRDGKVSFEEFQEIILKSLRNAGFEIYE